MREAKERGSICGFSKLGREPVPTPNRVFRRVPGRKSPEMFRASQGHSEKGGNSMSCYVPIGWIMIIFATNGMIIVLLVPL